MCNIINYDNILCYIIDSVGTEIHTYAKRFGSLGRREAPQNTMHLLLLRTDHAISAFIFHVHFVCILLRRYYHRKSAHNLLRLR